MLGFDFDLTVRLVCYTAIIYVFSHTGFAAMAIRRPNLAAMYFSVSIHFFVVVTLLAFSATVGRSWGSVSQYAVPTAIVMAASAINYRIRKG